jgi:hypothetical protein
LRLMHGNETLDSLDFDHEPTGHNQVHSIAAV